MGVPPLVSQVFPVVRCPITVTGTGPNEVEVHVVKVSKSYAHGRQGVWSFALVCVLTKKKHKQNNILLI